MSSSEEEFDAVTDVLLQIIKIQVNDLQKKRRKKRRMWVRNWISRREAYGASNTLLRELADEDPTSYFNFLRINKEMFQWLLEKVGPKIQKEFSTRRMPILAEAKLHVTLRYLATGDSFSSLEYLFRIPKCTISKFIPETLDAIYDACKKYMKVPQTEDEWKLISNGFLSRWNFPSCIGAIDGKHVVVVCPPLSGSDYRNYKGTFSIVLLALVDDDYNFVCIDVGSYGSLSDGGIFGNSKLYSALENDTLHVPEGSVILGDEGFALKTYLMKPFPRRMELSREEKIFNYRLSRARRIVENAFGILASRFRIYRRPIQLETNTVTRLVRATCALHNWIRKSSKAVIGAPITVDMEDTENARIIPGSWRCDPNACINLAPTESRNPTEAAKEIREQFKNYFVNEGSVSWQDKMID